MKAKLDIRQITFAALTGALYVTLCYFGNIFGLSFGIFQCRFAEALTVLPFLCPSSAWGLFAGCILSNIISPYGLPDLIFGSLATLAAGLLTARCRNKWLAPLPPVICNGVIVGALLAKEVARRVNDVDYPLLIASAYSGFVIWHAGLSGSIPLQMAAEGGKEFLGVVYQAPLTQTILHPMNIIMCLVILVGMPLINYAMHPDKEHTIVVNPALLQDEKEREYKIETPAEKMEHSKILWGIIVLAGFLYIIHFFITIGVANLDLNAVNTIFLFLGLLAHGDLRKYVDAIGDAAAGSAGVLLQFPFYAGIMGLMVAQNADGLSLAKMIADFFTSISTDVTFPLWTFLSGGIINFFVPSGGGQWAVQGPIVMPAATEIAARAGIDATNYYGRAAMGIAWGDQWTNMIQPFWALPALGVAGLKAKDIMGYLVVILIFTGIVACGGFLLWGMMF